MTQIEPTREWQKVIELALRSCDVLMAYVTPDFAQSRWTDQEVGWAMGRGVVLIPVKVGADPYGFFGTYQAVQVADPGDPRAVATAIVRAIAVAVFRRQRVGADRLIQPMATAVADAFCRSATFQGAARRFELLRLVPPGALTEAQLARLEEAVRGLEGSSDAHLIGGENVSLLDGLLELLARHRAA
jgi:TIR domain